MAEQLNWGVAGAGNRARESFIPALLASRSSRILGVCGGDAERTRNSLSKWPDLEVYDDLGSMVKNGEVQAVYIATPHFMHVPHAVQAIEAGKHVFMESPMALSVDGAHKLTEKARKMSVQLGVAFQYRFHPAVSELKARIDNGDLGEALHVSLSIADNVILPSGWWSDANRAGPAALLRFGVHALDLAEWLMPATVTEVMASGKDRGENRQDAIVSVSLRFGDGSLGFALGAGGFGEKNHSVKVEGEKGRISVEGDFSGAGPVEMVEVMGGKKKVKEYKPQDPVGIMVDSFAEAVLGDNEFSPAGKEGKKIVEITCAVIESMKSRHAVKVGEVLRLT